MKTETITESPTETKRGTPYSKKWDQKWRDFVDTVEDQKNRRCCGAHAPDGTPCQLMSTHENGRCRFHGGVHGIGAPKDNVNARIHGLYSRRLQQCGSHCPQWKTCLFAGPDVLKLDPAHRPLCAYEQREIDMLHELDQKAEGPLIHLWPEDPEPAGNPDHSHVVSLQANLNIMQVMITRASAAIAVNGMASETNVNAKNYKMTSEKTSAALTAFNALTREYRATLKIFRSLTFNGMPKRYLRLTEEDVAEERAEYEAEERASDKRFKQLQKKAAALANPFSRK
jgi:hypothetical protein